MMKGSTMINVGQVRGSAWDRRVQLAKGAVWDRCVRTAKGVYWDRSSGWGFSAA